MRTWATRILVIVAGVMLTLSASPPSGHAEPGNTLELAELSFLTEQVDVRTQPGSSVLRWRVTNSDTAAIFVQGELEIRMRADGSVGYLGLPHVISFSFGADSPSPRTARWVSGTPQDSTFEYPFWVPRYADRSKVTWEVTRLEANDAGLHSLTVQGARLGDKRRLVARTLVDSTPPTHGPVTVDQGTGVFHYVGGQTSAASFLLELSDFESTFWRGTATLTGPSGQTVTGEFGITDFFGSLVCGGRSGGGNPEQWICRVTVTLPADAEAGVWTLSAVELFDNAGNRSTTTETGPSVTATSNAVVSASDFTATPNPVNNWRGDVEVTMSMVVAGARSGIAEVAAILAPCQLLSAAPNLGPDGVVSLLFRFRQGEARCTLEAVRIVDGEGNVALYGPRFHAPDPHLVVDRLPNTAPPTATDVALSPDTVPLSQVGNTSLVLTMRVDTPVALLDSISVFPFDAAGVRMNGVAAFPTVGPDGSVTVQVPVRSQVGLGDYTVGFILLDTGDLSTEYGMPGGVPFPDGPLRFSVVPG